MLQKIAYCIANPVAAGLVRRAHQWPGVTVSPKQLGRTSWTAKRPEFYFDQHNPQWPEVAKLELCLPQLRVSPAALRDELASEVIRLELEAHNAVQSKGWRFLGSEKVATLSPYDRAKSWEPLRGRNPTFAVGRGQREAFVEAVLALRLFRKAYRLALETWRRGIRDVLFPEGTWLMVWAHRAKVAPS